MNRCSLYLNIRERRIHRTKVILNIISGIVFAGILGSLIFLMCVLSAEQF